MNPLAWHLQQAAERYGPDFPVRIAARSIGFVAPAAAAAAAAPAAPPPGQPPVPTAAAAAARAVEPTPAAATHSDAAAPHSAVADDPVAGNLDELRESVLDCARCKLHAGRKQVVFGEGNPDAELMFVGEAPGAREDEQGRPFVGPAGQLLTRIIENAIGLQRSDVYIANVNKCRPPNNRNPEPDEVAACLPILRRQIDLIQPKLIVAMGRVAAANLLETNQSVTRLRGRTLKAHDVPVVVTWHPAYLLRNPAAKVETWEDIKRVNRILGRPEVPPC